MEDYSCNGCGEHVLDCTCSKILRRERSTRVWQAIQCWLLMCCVEWRGSHDTAFVMDLLVKEAKWAKRLAEP